MKQQINFRASDLTSRQLDALMQHWGTSQTETLTVVIDRIYQQEIPTMTTDKPVVFVSPEMLGDIATDAAARQSSADPVIQRRLDEEIDAAWAEIRELEAGSDEEIFDIEGTLVFVNEYLVGVVGGHPSNVDYYYSEQGYGCTSAAEVAAAYYHNVVKQLKEATK